MRKISIIIATSLFLAYCGRSPIQLMEVEADDPRTELSGDQVLESPTTDSRDESNQEIDIPVLDTEPSYSGKYSVESSENLCEDNWIDASQLQIGPEKPTDLSGDTFAAYGPKFVPIRDRRTIAPTC